MPIKSQFRGVSEFCAIISSMAASLSLHPSFEVKFVRRQANMDAHTLARVAISWASHRIIEIIPPCI
jgi:hypothetical protein